MKINKDFTIREIAGEYILVPMGQAALEVSGLIMTNEVGAFIWELCKEETTLEEVVQRVVEEFEVDEKTAGADAREFIDKLLKLQIISDSGMEG